jgi:hypothetical protein
VYDNEKSLIWIGSSKKDLIALPVPVRKFFGHALHLAQNGEQHDAAKVLKGFGSAGVLELVEDDAGEPTAPSIPSSLKKRSSSCTASRRKAKPESAHRSARWKSFTPGSKWLRR